MIPAGVELLLMIAMHTDTPYPGMTTLSRSKLFQDFNASGLSFRPGDLNIYTATPPP